MSERKSRDRTLPPILGSLAAADFQSRYWERAAYSYRLPAEARIDFDLDDLATILTAPELDLDDIQIVSAQRRLGDDQVRKMRTAVEADREHLADGFAAGQSVIVRRVDRYSRRLALLRRDLVLGLGCRVAVNLFATPARVPTLGWHADPDATLAIQLRGSKDWRIEHPSDAGSECCYRLSRHDALYFPRGWRHHAVGSDGVSLSLSFAITPWTADAVLASYISGRAARAELGSNVLPIDLLHDPAGGRGAVEAALGAALERHLSEFRHHVGETFDDILAATAVSAYG